MHAPFHWHAKVLRLCSHVNILIALACDSALETLSFTFLLFWHCEKPLKWCRDLHRHCLQGTHIKWITRCSYIVGSGNVIVNESTCIPALDLRSAGSRVAAQCECVLQYVTGPVV